MTNKEENGTHFKKKSADDEKNHSRKKKVPKITDIGESGSGDTDKEAEKSDGIVKANWTANDESASLNACALSKFSLVTSFKSKQWIAQSQNPAYQSDAFS
ncbi:uncharacterized protein MONOS_9247 [Monocercomonoides exilis]|uniref:uncharacterized protein n=1 Tax=Monocercomonoides exilis TaxID=2049356 RepID=UPI00355A1025|nr:hypothetical protein MONOS_9247 [Monocercomonoides exilis]|eukprot:MONOS_9247.1-p1 / transcript=MONOS_9247.1 / gene=MONOS_9247 / organism=Monocercomonoides_exilis_PA203 / gene_product=unspecified product / transcript_product=unspecified product / location=Mono_scaffold00374:41727-42029(+) / protein_length=101 / sequence_SO=supercontig / SO=protein_coding / is_pseudo=false